MKFITSTLVVALLITIINSCDDLSDLNSDPHAYEHTIPEFLLTNSQLNGVSGVSGSYWSIMVLYGQAMQFYSNHQETHSSGDKYNDEGGARSNWSAYNGALNQIQRVINDSNDAESINILSAARIWRVYLFHQLTDLYGDIPYSEALKSFDSDFAPKYDRQEGIYLDMFKELEEAANAFNSDYPTLGNSDLLYNGNIVQWQRFAYSMMLRLGMRLTEVRAELAEDWVKKAIEGGVILEDTDIAYIEYAADGQSTENRNPKAHNMREENYLNPQSSGTRRGQKFAKTWIDHLKNTNDPRLEVIAVVRVEQPDGSFIPDNNPDIQRGMPSGVMFGQPDDIDTYSEPNRSTVLALDSPALLMTNAEMYLLLAEAAIRNWYDGDAGEAYNNGVRAGMRHWQLFGEDGIIAVDEINSYLIDNPFNTTGTFEEQFDQINTQKWVSLYLDDIEIFSNWRRTGYPDLVPSDYPGNLTGGNIPRRGIIPDSEANLNSENFNEALERQGVGNSLSSTVWWDPQH